MAFFLFSTVFFLLSSSFTNVSARVLGKPEPGEHDKCTSTAGPHQGYNCTGVAKEADGTPTDCKNDSCSMCYFCPVWNWGGPICSPDCAPAMGANLENIGIVCAKPECNGCDACNPNEIVDFQQKNQDTTLSYEDLSGYSLHGFLLAAASELVGNANDTVNYNPLKIAGYNGNSGAIKGVGTMIAFLYKNPPASGVEYLADVGRSFGLVKPVYAQGVGFTAMQQILPAWKAARNVAYIFFIIAFIISGFAIMFRMKISPQTVISIQNALPKMIVALILVTFSYAIAGLLIDISYLFLYLAVLAFGQTGWIDTAKEQVKLTNLNFWGGFGEIYGGSVKAMWSVVGAEIDSMLTGGPVIGGLLGAALASIIGIIGTIIIWIVALVLMFKLFFSLVACYVQVILLIFIGPILIAFDALPNGKNGFKGWLNKLMGNIMVFPGVAFMLMVGNIMSSKINISAWNPPLFGDRHDLAGPIFGFGILMMTAKMPEIIKGLFKIKDEGYGTAIGQAVFNPATKWAGDQLETRAAVPGSHNIFIRAGGQIATGMRTAGEIGGIYKPK